MVDLSAATRRYPEHELAIRRLAGNDHDFAELCDDFAVAVSALDRWSNDPERSREYRQIVRELKEEISRHLEQYQRASATRFGS